MYSKKTPLEHVLLRPGMYVGPVEKQPPTQTWVLEKPVPPFKFSPNDVTPVSKPTRLASTQMVSQDLKLISALIKIFDEILVNASDNRLRHPKTCTQLDVRIDPGTSKRDPQIRIWNNGKGIPIQIHKTEKIYVPEMLFGHLLTGSNFDDDEKRLTGGRHGYGAKLANIFSKSFAIETLDARKKLRYQQTWYDNMTRSSEPIITPAEPGEADYTCVTFVPDMPRLAGKPKAVAIDADDYAVMCRRVMDAAGCAGGKLQVFLNGRDVSMDSYAEYSNLYRNPDSTPISFVNLNARWTVGVGLAEDRSFESISFVNGMATPRGGTHVNAIVNQVVKKVQEKASKMEPSLVNAITPALVRRNLFVSCNALIENPTFDSQMKEYLTSSPNNFGSTCNLSDRYLKSLVEPVEKGGPGIIEEVLRMARGRQQATLLKQVGGKKSKRQLLGIPKLEDAHEAGSGASTDCTLILTEGDSAKALAVAGLEVIGRANYGVFPLRGKFLNVRHATVAQLGKNEEVKALVAILGLDFDKAYSTTDERSEMRYGHLMLMTDQDADGSHIKGLVINFFRHFWPELLKPPTDDPLGDPFLSAFVTPLLKATRKSKSLPFYSMADYNAWRASLESEDELKKWKIKYYKGLGTSTPAEAKEYFAEFDKHHRPFHWTSDNDGEILDKIFDKERASDRRDWIINEYDPESTLDFGPDHDQSVSFEDFVNKEMIHFSNADNIRSLPSVIDGLKPSQRKVLYACLKRKLKSEMKVAQLSGYCAEHTAYHHGEQSLQGTIIGMAQDFVGSNNLNLLVPSGQFGTRLTGGDDAASPRYIFTYLSPVTRHLFPEDDDVLLDYLEDDGQPIEPKYYCPVIPLLVVNGSQGIGTGWSTYIPAHNPLSVLDYIRAKLEHQTTLPRIEPFVRGFNGDIVRNANGDGYTSIGHVSKIDNQTILIDELPVGMWTSKYKELLLRLQSKGTVTDFVENHTTTDVSFRVSIKPSELVRLEKTGLEKAFKLTSKMLLTNMNAFDEEARIQKYRSPEAMTDAFFPVRLSLYGDRKSVLQSTMEYMAAKQRNKARFIEMVSDGEINLVGGRLSKAETSKTLHEHGFNTVQELESIKNNNTLGLRKQRDQDENVEADTTDKSSDSSNEFDYLLKMPMSSLTGENIEALTSDAAKMEKELADVRKKEPEELWMEDLEKLAKHL
eukprot:Nitzschia sp. Nitz4//scaffold38_size140716//73006//76697//NITZ4_003146-RA/size140716-snap-gene-0.164-mRNA-1//-1//CDS//3329550075//3157//frame0